MVTIMSTWLVLVSMMYFTSPTSSFKIYGVDLARRLRGISEEGLGRKEIQNIFDTMATFQTNLPNGEETVQMLASSLGGRLNNYNDAVEDLHRVLVKHYDELNTPTNMPGTKQCCKVNDTNLPYLEKFKAKTDTLRACLLYANDIGKESITVPEEVMNTLRNNDKNNENLAWQYFGNEAGLTLIYPYGHVLSKCWTFDPRSRPWYAEASAPTPKDIVIVFENTVGKTADSIKEAVGVLLNTANPNDRITVIAFGSSMTTYVGSSEYSPCYSQNLALVTPLNRDAFLKFVKDQQPSSGTVVKYLPALNKAFDYFKRSDEGEKRSKLLVFMAASDPSDVGTLEEIIKEVEFRNNPKVVIQTYAFGTSMSNDTRNILKSMAEMMQSNAPGGLLKKGTYTAIDPDTELRIQLYSYYNIFEHSTGINRPIVTVPYVDALGLGLVVSLCLPVHSRGALRGVACVDARLEDIFFNVTYYPQNSDTYVFIIDGHGRTILHPSLPKPAVLQDDPVFIDITTLERDEEAAEILASMKSGGNGSKTFYTHRAKHGPDDRAASLSHYHWMKVPYADYSLCIVFTDCDGTVDMSLVGQEKYVKYLHPNSLFSTTMGASRCQHAGTVATTDGSVVMFSGAAYRWLTGEVKPLDANQHQRYKNFFTLDADDQGEAFKRSTRSWVTLSGFIDEVWKDTVSSRYDSVILWRHLVTASGVIRVYPGPVYSHYDPSILSWYKLATLNPTSLIMKQMEHDNFNLIISQAIFKGSSDGHHTSKDMPVAVVAGEIKATFVYSLLEDLYPPCKQARCFIINWNGNVLAHKFYGNAKRKASHIITMEPAISQYLQDSGQMVRTSCLDFKDYRTLTSWTVTLNDFVITSKSPGFELHNVVGTNIFVGITWETSAGATTCDCQDVIKCQQDKDNYCQCPCYETLTFNFCNNTLPTSKLNSVPTCSILKERFDIIQPPPDSVVMADLNPCFITSCSNTQASSQCLEIDACTWCQVEGQDKPACHDTSLNIKCLDSKITTTASTTTAIFVAVIIICCLVIVLLLVLFFLLYCYGSCCPCVPAIRWANRRSNMNNMKSSDSTSSPSFVKLPRAPARPPANTYSLEDVAKEKDLTPIPPSMEGRINKEKTYIYNEKIYYEAEDYGTEQSSREVGDSGVRRMPSQEYIHPQRTRLSLDPSKLPAYSVSSEQKPPHMLFPLARQNPNLDKETQSVSDTASGSNPVVTDNILKEGTSTDQAKRDPVDSTSSDPYNKFHPLPQQQHSPNEKNQKPLNRSQKTAAPPPPDQLQKRPPPTEQSPKNTVPTIPTFPQGHPYHKPAISAKPQLASHSPGHPKTQSNPPSSTDLYQSEPHDLSKTSQLSSDSFRHKPSPPYSSRPPQSSTEIPHLIEDQHPIDLANMPTRLIQNHPQFANVHGSERPTQITLPQHDSERIHAISHGSNLPAGLSEKDPEDHYVNRTALQQSLADHDKELVLTSVASAQHTESNRYRDPLKYKSNNDHYAHGQEPLDYASRVHPDDLEANPDPPM